MAADQDGQASLIFHVVRCATPLAPAHENSLESLLAADPRVRRFTDVYRALATLLQRTPDATAFAQEASAVIVCVDDVSDDEFDFFRLLRAARPDVTLLAYGTPADSALIDRALQAGAMGRATPTEIKLLLTIDAPPPAVPDTVPPLQVTPTRQPPAPVAPAPPPATVSTQAVAPPTLESDDFDLDDDELPPLDEDDEPVNGDDDAEESLDMDDSETPARVPWLRYNDQPMRTGPGVRTPPAGPPRTPPENGTAGPERHGAKPVTPAPQLRPAGPPPLLSDEELRALLEDDVSALAPREEGPRQREQRSQGL